jgi:WD40 repeat protein
MYPSTGKGGILVKQVVAIEATLENGRVQIGSGYLVDQRVVLTAEHCTRDKTATGSPVAKLSVIADGSKVTDAEVVSCPALDLAVLILRTVPDDWPTDLQRLVFARVDRERSGELQDCEAVGFPLWQYDQNTNVRHSGELRGTINQTDLREALQLLLRIKYDAVSEDHEGTGEDFPWGGASGALVFHAGLALGVVIEHRYTQGKGTVQLSAFDKLARYAAAPMASGNEADLQRLDGAKAVADALKLPVLERMPVVGTPAARRLWRGGRWLFEPAQARTHFERRAHGQRSGTAHSDLFRGRDAALLRIRSWLSAPETPGLPLVVTGQPGAGKSALIARVALHVSRESESPGLAFHAANATVESFRVALANLAGLTGVAEEIAIVDEFRAMGAYGVVPVVVDALDEAQTADDRRQIAGMLKELAELRVLRLAVATRPLTAGNRFASESLLRALGVTADDSANLVDLDRDKYFEAAGLEEYAALLLARSAGGGTAWIKYERDKGLRSRVASAIAARAGRNYLVAGLAASALSGDEAVVDPASAGYDPAQIPGAVGEALDKYLGRMPSDREVRVRGLLTALAYARGEGLDDALWLRFTTKLFYPATAADLDELRSTSIADFLSQARSGAVPVTTLFHQALREELLRARTDRAIWDERAITQMLLADAMAMQGGSADWDNAQSYTLRHLASHARAANDGGSLLDRLLRDPGYLCAAEPGPMLEALADYAGPLTQHVQAYERFSEHRLVSAPEEWPAYLRLAAAQTRATELASAAADLPVAAAWCPRWAAWSPAILHRVLDRRPGQVRVMRPLRFAGRAALCVGSVDVLRILDVEDGRCLAQTSCSVNDLAVGDIPSGPVVFASTNRGNLLLWEPEEEGQDPIVLESPIGPASCAVAIGQTGGAAVAVAVTRDSDGPITAAAWDLNGVLRWARQLDSGVPKVAVSQLGSGDVAFVISSQWNKCLLFAIGLEDGQVIEQWNLDYGLVYNLTPLPGKGAVRLAYGGTKELVIVEVAPHTVPVSWLVPAQGLYEPVVTGTQDNPLLACRDAHGIRFRSAADGQDLGYSWLDLTPTSVAAVSQRDRNYILTGHYDGAVRRWRLDTLLNHRSDGPPAETQASSSAVVTAAADSVLIGAGDRIQRRDLTRGRLLAETSERFAGTRLRLLAPSGKQAERLVNYGGRGLIAMSPDSLEILHHYKADALERIEDIDTVEVNGQRLLATVASAEERGTRYAVHVWSAETMEHMFHLVPWEYIDKPLLAVRFAIERGKPVILAGGGGRAVWLWRLNDVLTARTRLVDDELMADYRAVVQHDDWVKAIAVDAQRPNHFVSVGDDGKVRITDIDTNQTVILQPPHQGPLEACCCIGRIVLAGGDAGILTAWRLESRASRETDSRFRRQAEFESQRSMAHFIQDDASSDQPLYEIRLDAAIRDITACPGGIVVATREGTITLDAVLNTL